MPTEDLLAAINAAIEPTLESEDADDTDEAELEDSSDGDEGADETGGDDGEATGSEDADGDGDEGEEEVPSEDASAEGDDKAAGKDGKPAAKPAAKDDGAAAASKDPLNDPVDPRLKEATRERITSLIDIAKTQTTRAEAAETQFNEVMGYIQQSRATPEQYSQALDYIGAVNSGDRPTMERAWDFMMGEMQALGRLLGKEVPGLDYLAAHPDLKQAIAAGQMTEAYAKETARLRDSQNHAQQVQQHTRQQQQTQEQQAAIITQGRNELNTLGAQLRAANPAEYAAKSAILTAALKGTFKDLDPRQWAAMYKRAYESLKLPAPAAPPVVKKKAPVNQPLRGQNPAGGAATKPKTMFDAISVAVDEAPRR